MALNHAIPRAQAQRLGRANRETPVDFWLLVPVLLLVALGVTMVGSSSIAVAESHGLAPHYYLVRHLVYLTLGLMLALAIRVVPIKFLEDISQLMFPLSVAALLLVFIPGLGYTVNGSTRWVRLGILNFQVVEAVKVMFIIYMAGYLVRKADRIRNVFVDTFKPLMLAGVLTLLLLLQPDMGSAAVITAVAGGMVWLAGAAWRHIAVLGLMGLPVFGYAAMEPYRLRRIVSFLDPWQDPFNSGFQLTQALIAVGRGEVFGVGLGASIQKLFYLPEAHTDFIFAVLAEEFGLVGVFSVLALFVLAGRAHHGHRRARPPGRSPLRRQRGLWYRPVAGAAGHGQHWREPGRAAHQGPDPAADLVRRQFCADDLPGAGHRVPDPLRA